jgi:aerobic carbon-monoxide dehydrogenase large subunit
VQRYLVVEDCGSMINPAIVDGQIRGGVAQGIAGVLFEHVHYDGDGQLQSTTFMDYLLPTAVDVPTVEIHHLGVHEAGEFRGVGEGGAMVAPAAVSSAIEDAIAHLGIRVTDQYLPPAALLELLEAAT